MICEHKYTRTIPSGNTTHYAKSVCTICGKFVTWKPKGSPLSTIICVPFNDKEEAKSLGARWDTYSKSWYCPTETKLPLFTRWLYPKENINAIN